jgi:Family of unknown function (DUF6314)
MTSPDSQHVFDLILGEWSFVREVPGQASMTGQATVCLQEDGTALYRETARIVLVGGEILHGEQRYLYRKTGDGFAVFFHDTRGLFHDLKFSVHGDGCLKASASHDCNADLYLSEYELRSDGSFFTQHTVRGPRKNYVLQTVYRKTG